MQLITRRKSQITNITSRHDWLKELIGNATIFTITLALVASTITIIATIAIASLTN